MPLDFQIDFSGKVALVTGGATGIGAASASALAAAGAQVVIVDVDEPAARSTVGEIEARGGSVEFVHCDVADEGDVEKSVAYTIERHGRLDIVHANAGLESMHGASTTTLEHWNRVLGVNLSGVFLVCRAALRHMYERGEGAIIVTSSPHANATVPDAAAYAASKGGVQALVRSMALEAAPHGVRVNAVIPGTIDTPMIHRELVVASDPEEQIRRFAASHPLGRLGRPDEVASAALFLASDAASFITGSSLSVDGGLMAALPSGPALSYNT